MGQRMAAEAADRVYRWKDADGKTYYGDTPPSGAQDVRTFDARLGGPARSPAPEAARDEEQVAAQDAECANKRNQLKVYRGATRLVERDSLGGEREYTLEERQKLVAKVEAELQAQCGDEPAE